MVGSQRDGTVAVEAAESGDLDACCERGEGGGRGASRSQWRTKNNENKETEHDENTIVERTRTRDSRRETGARMKRERD